MSPSPDRRRRNQLLARVALVALALAAWSRAALAGDPQIFSRGYLLRYITLHEAEALAWKLCPPNAGIDCVVESAESTSEARFIRLRADAATHAKLAQVLLEQDSLPRTMSFQVLLVLADQGPGSTEAALPGGAARAIADLKGFLPYTRYRTLDSSWVRTGRQSQTLMQGPGGAPVEVVLTVGERVADQVSISEFQVLARPRADSAGAAPPPPKQLIRTQFGLRLGETVVVGTSKLDGAGEALIALVTAVN
ncbi:MAG TPA: hypothetical protein PK413_07285 [Thermoanaerobaculia bacterium]|nr:hypothetical protein [Thermoanaerobaculia bacterium]